MGLVQVQQVVDTELAQAELPVAMLLQVEAAYAAADSSSG